MVKPRFELAAKTFRDCALELIRSKRSGWRNVKHAQQWENTLAQYAYPRIGAKLPADVSLADLKAILLPLWATKQRQPRAYANESKLYWTTRRSMRGAIDEIPRDGKAIRQVLPPARKVTKRIHHPAAPYTEVPRIMAALRDKDFLSAYCLRLHLTAARSGEARGALWREIDLGRRIWTIPGHE